MERSETSGRSATAPVARRRLIGAAAALGFVLLANVVALGFVGAEHRLYTADHVAYWSMSSSLAEAMRTDAVAAAVAISNSVSEKQLNLLPATPIALLMLAFGDSRTVYILAILNLYGLPSLAVLWMFLYRCGVRHPGFTTLATVLLLPSIWFALSLGYVGIGGLGLALAALLAYFDPEFSERRPTAQILIGFLLALLFIFRRWYGFFSFGFGLLVVVDCIAACVTAPRQWRRLADPVLIGGAAALTMIVLALPRIVFDLTSDYGNRFGAFKTQHGLLAELAQWPNFFGALALIVAAIGALSLAAEAGARRFAAFVTGLMIVIFLAMRQVQDPTPQHFYLYTPSLMLLIAMAIDRVPGRRALVAPLIAAIGILSSIAVFRASPDLRIGGLLPATRIVPVARPDLDEVNRLLGYLDGELQGAPGFIAVLGSNPTMCDTALSFANLSLDTDYFAPRYILLSAHIDERDGFPVALLHADYVIVTDPLQCREPPDEMRVVEVPGRAFLEGRHVARAFTRLPETFDLENDVRAFVFKRTRPTTQAELAALSSELRTYYPDRPEIYAPAPEVLPPDEP